MKQIEVKAWPDPQKCEESLSRKHQKKVPTKYKKMIAQHCNGQDTSVLTKSHKHSPCIQDWIACMTPITINKTTPTNRINLGRNASVACTSGETQSGDGFWGFQKPLRIFPRRWVRPFSATAFHEAYTVGWIAVLTGLCFDSKCSEDRFFWSPRRKIGDLRKNLCCSVTGNSARRSHRTRPRQTGCLETTQRNLYRTAPGHNCDKTSDVMKIFWRYIKILHAACNVSQICLRKLLYFQMLIGNCIVALYKKCACIVTNSDRTVVF